MRHRHSLCLCLLTTALISACGGGGDSAGPPPNTTFNAAAAYQNLLTTTNSWTVSGVASDSATYQISVSIAPAGTAVFPVTGVTANKSNLSSTIQRNGTTVASGLAEVFFDNNLFELGSRFSASGEADTCDLATAGALPSAAATIGASGSLSTSSSLDGCAGTSNVIGTTTSTWSVELHDGIAYFCTNASSRDTASPPNVSTDQECFEMSTNGTLGSHARVVITGDGVSLTAHN